MMDGLVVRTRAYSDDLKGAALALEDEVWEPLGFLNFTKAHREHYSDLLDAHADLQLCLVEEETGRPVALANCVPAPCRGSLDDLPPEGWDWLVEAGSAGDRTSANVLGALAISVPPVHRGKGYAQRMIRELRDLSGRLGFEALVAPVRPSAKCHHPHVPIADYVGWTDAGGRCFDPWLRSHLSQGGRLVGPCERSMVVEEHVAFWETWAGQRFETSGEHLVAGALVPISIDLERQVGRYEEPNVWVTYAS